jgi:hypothetical protein
LAPEVSFSPKEKRYESAGVHKKATFGNQR